MSKLIHLTSIRLFFTVDGSMAPHCPLIHIHTLDVQENSVFSELFLAYTVFSPDLAGEYSPQSAIRQAGTQENQYGLSTHFSHYFEQTRGLFSENDSKRKKRIEPALHAHFFPPTKWWSTCNSQPCFTVFHVVGIFCFPARSSVRPLLIPSTGSLNRRYRHSVCATVRKKHVRVPCWFKHANSRTHSSFYGS